MQLRAAVSRSHLDGQTDAWLRRLRNVERIGSGSAVKFCRVAEGTADVYPRLAPMYEWDIAAGDAIVTIAGGSVATPAGTPITYGRNEDLIVSGFIAWGDPSIPGRQAAHQVD
jgi:3'(2'), 5'-bisphosphate nucleotidase